MVSIQIKKENDSPNKEKAGKSALTKQSIKQNINRNKKKMSTQNKKYQAR